MATWEDGPEYAPVQRPAAFTEPEVTPLTDPPGAESPPPAPTAQPRFEAPAAPVAALATLVPAEVGTPRDPQLPFEVVSATMTPDPALSFGAPATGAGAWGAAHWSPPVAGAAAGPWSPPGAGPWPASITGTPTINTPAGGGPWPVPTTAAPAPSAPPPGYPAAPWPAVPAPTGQGFPAPGTDQWFGPGPGVPPPPAPTSADPRAVLTALTPAVAITLGIGLFYTLAPFTLGVALFLTTRMQVAREAVQRVFLGALVLLTLIAIVAALTTFGGFGDWWSTVSRWALFLSVVVGVSSYLLVRRALLARTPAP